MKVKTNEKNNFKAMTKINQMINKMEIGSVEWCNVGCLCDKSEILTYLEMAKNFGKWITAFDYRINKYGCLIVYIKK